MKTLANGFSGAPTKAPNLAAPSACFDCTSSGNGGTA